MGFPFTTLDPLPDSTVSWFVQPSLGLAVTFNDNIRYRARDRESDVIVSVTPGILVAANSPRVTGIMTYTPRLSFYLSNSEENRLTHAGNAQFTANLVQDRLFVDARASAYTENLFGGFIDNTVDGARRNEVQTITASVSPYLVQRFGSLANARAGYIFAVTDQTRGDPSRPVLVEDPIFGPRLERRNFAANSFLSHTGYATVRTGEDFGRVLLQGNVFGTTYEGDGIYENAYRWAAFVESGYAITRAIAVVGDLGYEKLEFNTVPKTDISGLLWAIGVRVRPSETSDATVKYGRRDGYEAFQGEASTNLFGPRTRLFVNYSDRLTNTALQAAELLQTTTLDPFGNPVFAANGAPVSPGFSTGQLGVQNGLFRTRRASVSIRHALTRDVFVLNVSYENRRPFAADPRAAQQVPTEGASVGLSWSRPLDELTNFTSYVRYGVRSTGERASSDANIYAFGAVLTRTLSPTLSGSISYRFDARDEEALDDLIYRNVVVAAIRKTF
ncbi:MAG: TIGR03016 family PEP-CTERM system-associated outer membrane protein [Acetobacteraceae bacterium]